RESAGGRVAQYRDLPGTVQYVRGAWRQRLGSLGHGAGTRGHGQFRDRTGRLMRYHQPYLHSARCSMALTPDRRSRNLTQNVVAALSERIRRGEFHAGEKLPTESRLMESFGVSRTVI